MGLEKIINKLSKGAMVKFKGSDKAFYVKNVPSLDSDHVFVTNSDGSATFRKQLSKLDKINGKDVVVSENIQDKVHKILITEEQLEMLVTEDLAVWFGTKKKPKGSKQPKGPWVNICRKDKNGKHPPCGRPEASTKSYPKCRAAGVAGKMSDAQKKAACAQKRKAEKSDPKIGKGNKPTMTSYKPRKKK